MTALYTGRTVAVIGSGAMGAGIAQVAAVAGYTVRLFDTRPEAVDKAISGIASALDKLVAKERISAADCAAAVTRLHAAPALDDVADAGMVVEAIVENLEAKRGLFAQLEAIVADDCILATNTSSISVTAIAAGLRLPGRVVGMHFFNPVPLMALCEVVSGLATDGGVAQTVYDTAAAWGKIPVHAKSTPGFIVNRVARPFYAEGWRLLNEQAADAATIDAVMREAGGFRMGPFELMDLIGHDVNFSVTQSVFNAYFGDPRFTPSVLQQEMVNAGFLGRKAGRGFYHYGDAAATLQAQAEAPQPKPEYVSYTVEQGAALHAVGGAVVDALAARLRAAGIEIAQRRTPEAIRQAGPHDDAPAFHCNGAAVYLTDGRSATQRARDNHHPDTVLVDLALDYGGANRIAVACADQCTPAAYRAVVGLLQAAGFTVTRLDDVPGMAVMRTVAMLANEAADAVNQGVCSAAAADIAMQKGVNYPRGPLAWADAVGIEHIVRVLTNLASSYGEDRYRVSPLLRRKQASGGRFHD
ncbi:3-hydroxybutyryl-CoA dehydrogenase [Duganella sp. CF402]|uniref:3-hydroxyacyl-CoA dehydrogenase PaaH n=1 Tax=unclassified Duganella TaxID=2636909 RepID=UPI0008B35C4F|nr:MULTISPECIES: 3-hydroxyacyl-CoA dehydrogenase PaaH [unclassified Duganella]RZT08465.1 3-hydroxyacyl-CoA dehydrogenase [Duganella sp. BK701]SEL92896.1 3-hydroxybutyryl-CoA dehydrogenase [Duganella sp. CF402]